MARFDIIESSVPYLYNTIGFKYLFFYMLHIYIFVFYAQAAIEAIVNPPVNGEPSYEQFNQVKRKHTDRLKSIFNYIVYLMLLFI